MVSSRPRLPFQATHRSQAAAQVAELRDARPTTSSPRVAPGEAIPLDDGSVDAVICSLVLCTVATPPAVLAEIKRVLRPGGTFRFVEHVAARPISPRRWLQRILQRPWAWRHRNQVAAAIGQSPGNPTATAMSQARPTPQEGMTHDHPHCPPSN